MDIKILGILDILKAVYSGEIGEGNGSKGKINRLNKKRGVLTSVMGRRIFEAIQQLIDNLEIMDVAYKITQAAKKGARKDCKALSVQISRISERIHVLQQFLWLISLEQQPLASVNQLLILNGWEIHSEGSDWDDTPILFEDEIIKHLHYRIFDVANGKFVNLDQEGLPPSNPHEKEIAKVDDPRLKTLCWLFVAVVKAGSAALRKEMSNLEIVDSTSAVGELVGFHVKQVHLAKIVDVVMSLFCCAARDLMPELAGTATLGIRSLWKIVAIEKPKEHLFRIRAQPPDENSPYINN